MQSTQKGEEEKKGQKIPRLNIIRFLQEKIRATKIDDLGWNGNHISKDTATTRVSNTQRMMKLEFTHLNTSKFSDSNTRETYGVPKSINTSLQYPSVIKGSSFDATGSPRVTFGVTVPKKKNSSISLQIPFSRRIARLQSTGRIQPTPQRRTISAKQFNDLLSPKLPQKNQLTLNQQMRKIHTIFGISRECKVELPQEEIDNSMKKGWNSMIQFMEAQIRSQANPYHPHQRKVIKNLDLQSCKAKPKLSQNLIEVEALIDASLTDVSD